MEGYRHVHVHSWPWHWVEGGHRHERAPYTRSYGSVEETLNPSWWDEENWLDRVLSELALKAEGDMSGLRLARIPGSKKTQGPQQGGGWKASYLRASASVGSFWGCWKDGRTVSRIPSCSPATQWQLLCKPSWPEVTVEDTWDLTLVYRILAKSLRSGFCILSLPPVGCLTLGLSFPSCHTYIPVLLVVIQ